MESKRSLLIFCLALAAAMAAPCNEKVRWGPWLDRDNPSGNGDYETRNDERNVCENPTAIQCRIKGTK